jgi:hypothetical protein
MFPSVLTIKIAENMDYLNKMLSYRYALKETTIILTLKKEEEAKTDILIKYTRLHYHTLKHTIV